MKIGIVIAIARELKAFLESDFDIKVERVSNREIYLTKANNNELIAIKSGCGLIDAAAATQLLITKFNCDLIINFGVTGAIVSGLKVEDLFIATKTCAYGYDVSPIDHVKVGQYEEFEDVYIPLSQKYIDIVKNKFPDLKEAVVASGDKFVERQDEKIRLNREFNCNICDMEIGAIARTCYLNNVDCLSIKCISDTFEGNGGDFITNVNRSAKKAFNIIKELLFTL